MRRRAVPQRRRFTVFAAVLTAAVPRVAQAFSTSRLEYERGPGTEACPEEPVIRAKVAERLGYDPFVDVASKTIVVRVSRGAERLRARVELVDPPSGWRWRLLQSVEPQQ